MGNKVIERIMVFIVVMLVAVVPGFVYGYSKNFTDDKAIRSLIFLVINIFVVFGIVYLIKRPYGKLSYKEFIDKLGLKISDKFIKLVLLGLLLGIIHLMGMLIGSILTGKYILDFNNITLEHILFSLNPGIFEEICYRSIIMFIFLGGMKYIKGFKSLKIAVILQAVLFALAHLNSLDVLGILDVFSIFIIALGFTYYVFKTNSLIPAIMCHFLHDAFLYFVQNPGAEYHGVKDISLFSLSLFIFIGIGCLIVKFITDKFAVAEERKIYKLVLNKE